MLKSGETKRYQSNSATLYNLGFVSCAHSTGAQRQKGCNQVTYSRLGQRLTDAHLDTPSVSVPQFFC